MKSKIIYATVIVAIAISATFFHSCSEQTMANTTEKGNAAVPDDMDGWSDASKIAVMDMKKKYGEPAERTGQMMMWENTGQWKRTVIYAKEFQHDFPMPHTDVMQQWIDYDVPPEKFTELAHYDGSVVCNRTNGVISARCDLEGANFLAINLAYDIIKGNKDVESARDFYATAMKEMINGGKPAYMQKLQFDVPGGNTNFTDKPSSIITQDDMKKAKEMKAMMKKEMSEKDMMNMEGWSDASKIAVMQMTKKYGEPAERTEEMMMWENTGQWKKTVIYAKEFQHDFPMPHTDVMQQWIDYDVPPEKFTELAHFDGSVVCNRTNGVISARCDLEGANFLAINLAHDIIKGNKDVESARDFYATAMKEMINGGKPDYVQKLQFDVPGGNTVFTDKPSPIITQDDMTKAKKMKEMMKEEMMGMNDGKK